MAKLVEFTLLDNQIVLVNAEAVRAVLPQGSNALIVYGDAQQGVVVTGSVQSVKQKFIS